MALDLPLNKKFLPFDDKMSAHPLAVTSLGKKMK
jgi:hypothetical protein